MSLAYLSVDFAADLDRAQSLFALFTVWASGRRLRRIEAFTSRQDKLQMFRLALESRRLLLACLLH